MTDEEILQLSMEDKLKLVVDHIENMTDEEFENQIGFAREFELSQNGVNNCINNKQKIHKGWTFKVKE